MSGAAQDHANALLALLRADPGLTVYPKVNGAAGSGTGLVPAGSTPPYVAVHVTTDRPLGETLDMRSIRVVVRAYCHCVGANPTAARAVADRVAAALLDVKPAVTGRTVWPIRHDASQPPRNDESTGALVVDLVDVYRLESLPA